MQTGVMYFESKSSQRFKSVFANCVRKIFDDYSFTASYFFAEKRFKSPILDLND